MKRFCQCQMQVFDLLVRWKISLVLNPSALNKTIAARLTYLCGELGSA